MADLTLQRTSDPEAFAARAGEWLARDPVLGTVVTTTVQRALAAPHDVPGHPRWWGVLRDGSEVVGVVMRTAPFVPYPPYVLPMSDDAARVVAVALAAEAEPVVAVNGALPAAAVVAEEMARRQGGRVEVGQHTRLLVLDDPAALVEPAGVLGGLRMATREDWDVVLPWWVDFMPAAARQAGREVEPEDLGHAEPEDVGARVDAGQVWLWEVDGRPVHLSHLGPTSYGVARIGPVYTPESERGHGYAAATVAALTRRVLVAGDRACLFTDQANPVSNHIYPAMGYRAVTDMANLRIVAPPS